MKKYKRQHRSSLENEIITAVVILYLFIATVMVTMHYIQPSGQETVTSSTSPSHSEQSIHKPETR